MVEKRARSVNRGRPDGADPTWEDTSVHLIDGPEPTTETTELLVILHGQTAELDALTMRVSQLEDVLSSLGSMSRVLAGEVDRLNSP
jgi:hypothetical protein